MKDTYRTPIRFPRELWETLKRLAQEDSRSFNAEVVWILRNYTEGRAKDVKSLQVPPLSEQRD